MTSARLDALVMNDSKSPRDAGCDPQCPLCGSGYDNLQHALLTCKHEQSVARRHTLEDVLVNCLNEQQLQQLQQSSDHDKRMLLLGKKFEMNLSADQDRRVDSAMKEFLATTDDYRTKNLGLNPMAGKTYTQPPEESMQQAALWNRLWAEEMRRREQAGDMHAENRLFNDMMEVDGSD